MKYLIGKMLIFAECARSYDGGNVRERRERMKPDGWKKALESE